MTSTIKVDNINKISDDSNIIKKCGSTTTVGSGSGQTIVVDGATVTLGRCGGAVNLAPGASQTGFGRTGTVDWCTTVYTNSPGTVTSVSGKGYFLNTTSGAITVTLPSSPSAGDIISIKDYARTFSCNNVTLNRNSSKMDGACLNSILSQDGTSATLIYVDATKGWQLINDDVTSQLGGSFYAACGGNTTLTSGDYKTHIFTSDGNFTISSVGAGPSAQAKLEYIVVAGGGASGCADAGSAYASAGGGAGGFRSFVCGSSVPINAPAGLELSAATYPITVGAGGTFPGTNGGNSVFSTITSTGGGQGGRDPANPLSPDGTGLPGGSGGGGGAQDGASGGSGNTPSVTPPQGNDGGDGTSSGTTGGGAGGGATAVGGCASAGTGGAGGTGAPIPTAFFGPNSPSYGTPGPATGRYFAGGGGGGGGYPGGTGTGGAAGSGGGAAGVGNGTASNGTANTGGGGGGSRTGDTAGGSGIVAIRYKFQ